jgi:UDP-N-acetyl-D-glucosamine dehydrogenase
MPGYVVERTSLALNDQRKPLRGSKILIYGVAYKRDVSDVRESPAIAVIHGLAQRGADVCYLDPYVPKLDEDGVTLSSVGSEVSFSAFDAVVIVTDHKALDRRRLLAEAQLIVDTRDALHDVPGDRSKVYGL